MHGKKYCLTIPPDEISLKNMVTYCIERERGTSLRQNRVSTRYSLSACILLSSLSIASSLLTGVNYKLWLDLEWMRIGAETQSCQQVLPRRLVFDVEYFAYSRWHCASCTWVRASELYNASPSRHYHWHILLSYTHDRATAHPTQPCDETVARYRQQCELKDDIRTCWGERRSKIQPNASALSHI